MGSSYEVCVAMGTARPDHGSAWYDVRKWGGRAGDTTGIDSTLDAIRASIYARMVASWPNVQPSVICFPDDPNPWLLNDPVPLGFPNLTVKGESRYGTTVKKNTFQHDPIFINGLADAIPGAFSFDSSAANRWPDARGIVDNSLAPAAGRYRGLRTRGDATVACHGSPMAGPGNGFWSHAGGFAATFIVSCSGGVFPAGDLFGMVDGWTPKCPQPWALRMSANNVLEVQWKCQG